VVLRPRVAGVFDILERRLLLARLDLYGAAILVPDAEVDVALQEAIMRIEAYPEDIVTRWHMSCLMASVYASKFLRDEQAPSSSVFKRALSRGLRLIITDGMIGEFLASVCTRRFDSLLDLLVAIRSHLLGRQRNLGNL
jgi:hypothetical protein